MRARHRRLIGLIAATVAMLPLAACSSEDVTGEPDDIGELVHVDTAGSRCEHDRDDDSVRFVVRLENTGGDERTVAITPVRRVDGRDVGTSLDGTEMTVPGNGSAEDEVLVDDVPDELEACLVQIDSGDAAEIPLR